MGGFRNFVELFTKPTAGFGMLVRNTVLLALLKFVFGFLCAILLAVLFNYLKNGIFKKTVQTISYFPYFISWVTVSGLSYLFLATDGGLLNQMLAKIGVGAVNWYTWGIRQSFIWPPLRRSILVCTRRRPSTAAGDDDSSYILPSPACCP